MDITYQLEGATFEWDGRKALDNAHKHGVTFAEASEAFFDPFCQGGDASVAGEMRSFTLGYSLAGRLLLVVHAERSRTTRIISARVATRAERRAYEQA